MRAPSNPAGYRFELVADELDLDRYLPIRAQAQPGSKEISQHRASKVRPVTLNAELPGRGGAAGMLSVGTPAQLFAPGLAAWPAFWRHIAGLDLDGRLRAGALKLAGLRFGDADLRIHAGEGRLDIDNRVTRFYEGRLAGNASLDVRGPEPTQSLVQRADQVRVGPLLADLTGSDLLSGKGDITADLTASGWNADELRRNLGGSLEIHVPKGTVKDINLEKLVRGAEARLTGRKPPAGLPTQTDFTDLSASAEIKDGLLSNRDLVASADYLRVTGKGTIDLVRGRFDYRFEPMFVKPPKGRGIKELEGIPIPVLLTGPFDRLRWEVDVAKALSAAAERRFGEQGSDLLKKLEERTGIKGLEQGLRGLFGR
jgi:AsmA protein